MDGSIMPSEGGTAAYFWKAAFLYGGIIPSRAWYDTLCWWHDAFEERRILCGWRDASIRTC